MLSTSKSRVLSQASSEMHIPLLLVTSSLQVLQSTRHLPCEAQEVALGSIHEHTPPGLTWGSSSVIGMETQASFEKHCIWLLVTSSLQVLQSTRHSPYEAQEP